MASRSQPGELTPDQKAQVRAAVLALPPLTPEQLDRLADALAEVEVQARLGKETR